MTAAPSRAIEALTVDGLSVSFTVAAAGWPRRKRQVGTLAAVSDVSFTLAPGEGLGVVGESGCGKSTLARAIAGLAQPTSGVVRLGNQTLSSRRSRSTSRRIQMVFQDPASSLNPRMTVRSMLTEILRVHEIVDRSQVGQRLEELMRMVELPPGVLDQRPRALSGGQRQRVGIARALAPLPELIILDEAIASLDVSVQAAVLQLLRTLQGELGLAMIFISHDLSAVRGLCARVAVMYLGRIVEVGPVEEVLARPAHPYTRALIAAEPSLDETRLPGAAGLAGEPPSAINLPTGCAFRNRCPVAQDSCADSVPTLNPDAHHDQACFFPIDTVVPAASQA